MMVVVILVVAAVWLLLSFAVSLAVAAIGRGGLSEDRSRGYLIDHR